MNEIIEISNNFLNKLYKVKDKFEEFNLEIKNKDEEVKNSIQLLKSLKEEPINYKSSFEELLNVVKQDIQNYLSIAEKKLKEYSEGIDFIQEYEKSFIIFVYGKVKAGKSALGNFILGKYFRDIQNSEYTNIGLPEIIIWDRGEKRIAKELEEFEEKPTEATNAIQLFTLGSITWVDTPGIGSLTIENQKKAEEYVQHADLVIYLTSSDAVCRQSDVEELIKLNWKDKPFLIIIPKSDTDEPIIKDGNVYYVTVPKSEKDRREQENYVKQQIEKLKLKNYNNLNILSISVKLAKIAIKEGDVEKFYQSNLPQFYKLLLDIVCSEQGIKLKQKNPKAKFNNLIDTLVNGNEDKGIKGLNKIKSELYLIKKKYFEKIEDFENIEKRIIKIITPKAENTFIDYLKSNKSFDYNKKIFQEFNEIFQKEIKKLLKDTSDISIKSLSLNLSDFEIKKKYETIEYKVKEYYKRERSPEGLWEKFCSFFGKKYYTYDTRVKVETKKVEAGTNINELIEVFNKKTIPEIEKFIKENLEIIKKQFFEPYIDFVESAISNIDRIINKLERLRY